MVLHGSGAGLPASTPHPHSVGAPPSHDLLSQSSIWHPRDSWGGGGSLGGHFGVTLVASITGSRPATRRMCSVAQPHLPAPAPPRHPVTAPAGAAAPSGEGLLFWEECFHLAYIKHIHFTVTRQAGSWARASLQLHGSQRCWHTHSPAHCLPGRCLMPSAPICIPRGCCSPPRSCSAPKFLAQVPASRTLPCSPRQGKPLSVAANTSTEVKYWETSSASSAQPTIHTP